MLLPAKQLWKILLIGMVSSCLAHGYTLAQEEESEYFYSDTLSTQVDLFSVEDPMDLTLMFDIKSYQRHKSEGEYMPVQLTYHVNDTLDINKKVRVKARGNFRRKYCTLPPFWLNIKKANVENKYLEGTNKIKIVTHCINSKLYEQYVIKEYLTYKIYNEISPYSFRVRLIHMKYIDTGRKNKETHSWAFMIEPEEMMADRLGMASIKSDHVSMHYTDPSSMDLVAVFMYMIGNADYSVAGRHNLKLIAHRDPARSLPVPVPYDFDYAGVVNANYAVPGENLGISAVTERYFLGPCREDRQYLTAIEKICEDKEEILQLVDSSPYLDSKNKQEMSQYLQDFFTEAEKPDLVLRNFQRTCREKR